MGQAFSVCLGDLCTRPPSDAAAPVVEPTVSAIREHHVVDVTGKCCFGAGCYWGTEKYFKHDFAKINTVDGLITSGAVGFMGPLSAKENPNYEDVCTGVTGHVEVYDCEFTGGAPFYEAMVRFFFQFHDPTTMNKQGNDSGTQYASVIYCYDLAQYKIATAVKAELQLLLDLNRLTCFQTKVVSTDIRMVESDFFPAQQKHQDYLAKNPRVSLQNSSRSYEMIHTLICPKATHYSLVLNLTITSFLC
jgi:peptide-methionine (S)-S-oxide reductase